MRTILFIDEVCNKPYDPYVLETEGLGGTEATVIRVAEALAKTGLFEVAVAQHDRYTDEWGKAQYTYLAENDGLSPHYVISLRSPATLAKAKKRFPNAKHFLWAHDLATDAWARDLAALSGFETIAVSQFHKTQMSEVLKPQGYNGQFPIKVIYNPIDDDLKPDVTPVDRNKLVFFSSPHKGLSHALDLFQSLLRFNPEFTLYVANPGYFSSPTQVPDRVCNLGALPHPTVINHVRSSLCVFYPNMVFPETFGLVFAEANAVGTPVLTHPIGAATEVLYHPYETVDCRNPKAVIDRVMSWHSGDRPRVRAKREFRLSEVIKSWIKLFS